MVDDKRISLTQEDSKKALDINNKELTINDHFIRDCFDNFFYHAAILEHWERQGLVDLNDVKYPMEYYVITLKKSANLWPVAEAYLNAFGSTKAQDFFKRFDRSMNG